MLYNEIIFIKWHYFVNVADLLFSSQMRYSQGLLDNTSRPNTVTVKIAPPTIHWTPRESETESNPIFKLAGHEVRNISDTNTWAIHWLLPKASCIFGLKEKQKGDFPFFKNLYIFYASTEFWADL
jgi:hypothetical protein